ncbi:hypothetical protein MBLNU230_g5138t1 [Neophaeotheca triangularis]
MATKPTKPQCVTDIENIKSLECGREAAKQFQFDAGYRNLNHGAHNDTERRSFGTYPTPIKHVLQHFQTQSERRPDAFIRYAYPGNLDESREAVAKLLKAPADTCVYVPNATTGINTVMRGLDFQAGDVIVYFATIYGACEKTVSYVCETTEAESWKVAYTYPVSDEFLCAAFEKAVREIKAQGKRPRIAIFDTIVSLPGVRMPFERLTELCREHGVLSCVDGAHGIGHIPLDLGALDPDFFVSNCHKWLHVPRGCAVFYVPERNQHLVRSTLPTSHGYQPKATEATINNPLPPSGKSDYVTNFEFVGTMDNSPYLCVPAAIEWRKKLTWAAESGEEAVMAYTAQLARQAGDVVSKKLGTEVLENEEGTLGKCNFANVRLPLSFESEAGSDHGKAIKIAQWIAQLLVEEYDTFIAIIFYGEAWWMRLSSQVYLTLDDFEWAADVLLKVCERVKAAEWVA